MSKPKLHNAMWPGLVGKGDDEGQEPPISLERMLELTAAAEVNGTKFDGIDYFLFLPHTDPAASDDDLKGIADMIQSKGFDVGSLVAPIWPGTVGDSAMGDSEQQGKFPVHPLIAAEHGSDTPTTHTTRTIDQVLQHVTSQRVSVLQ